MPTDDPPTEPALPAIPVRDTVPVYGGTLAGSSDHVVVADPALDAVLVVDVARSDSVAIELPSHSEPFRVFVDDGLAFVTLRGSGQLAAIDLVDGSSIETVDVCAEPRGVAVAGDQVLVACASGELVHLDRALSILRTVLVEDDLRDVVIEGETVWVSTFRSAEVLALGRETLDIEERFSPDLVATNQLDSQARVGWRMRAHPDDGVLLLHLAATTLPIDLDRVRNDPDLTNESPYGGDVCTPSSARSATHFTHVRRNAPVARTGGPLITGGLRYDFAFGPSRMLFLPNARLRPSGALASFGFLTTIALDRATQPGGCKDDQSIDAYPGPMVTAVEFVDDQLWTYSREGRRLTNGETTYTIGPAPDEDDHAFQLFHIPTFTGLACATCHPEGQDDGHVWTFVGIGPRRTMSLSGGVSERAPFHWQGQFGAMSDLLDEIFTGRLAGPPVDTLVSERFVDWIDGIPPIRRRAQDPDLVAWGNEVFQAAGCAGCHAGRQLTDSRLHEVRDGDGRFKTPSLVGIGGRAPYMHDGCAETLLQSLVDEDCGGGDRHGTTSTMSSEELAALVAWLETL